MDIKRLIIDRGHGLGNTHPGVIDSGAVSQYGMESSIVSEVAASFIKGYHPMVEILLTPEVSRHEVVAFVNNRYLDGDVLFVLHMNEGGGRGTEVIVAERAPRERRREATALCLAIATAMGLPARGVKLDTMTPNGSKDLENPGLPLVRDIKCPSFLIEMGFIDNRTDVDRVLDNGAMALMAGVRTLRSLQPLPNRGELL